MDGKPIPFEELFQRLKREKLIPKNARPSLYRLFWLAARGAISASFLCMATSAETLVWNANTETNLASYVVHQAPTVTGPWTTTATTFTTLPLVLADNVKNYFYVTAINTSGFESAPSATISYARLVAAAPAPVLCVYTLASSSASFSASGGSGSVTVTASDPSCAVKVTGVPNWFPSYSSPTWNGNGTFSFTVASNPYTSSRSATLLVAGQSFYVSQSGAKKKGHWF